ncbi:hypothetical protein [Streptomyces sp. NPDC006463]|uniref:hypothetical protein n=1 Tax=Streptomyces sp. NPDC006463 TaxID=3364746 RepID=UPI0036A7735D
MRSAIGLSPACLESLRDLREKREINTVMMRAEGTPPIVVTDVEANLTHEELLEALSAEEPRLIVHELAFATKEGTRRHEHVLILWMPPPAEAQEDTYTAGYAALQGLLPDVHVHLTARRTEHLAYPRLVALAG